MMSIEFHWIRYADPRPFQILLQIGQKSDRVGNASGLTPRIRSLALACPRHKQGNDNIFETQADSEVLRNTRSVPFRWVSCQPTRRPGVMNRVETLSASQSDTMSQSHALRKAPYVPRGQLPVARSRCYASTAMERGHRCSPKPKHVSFFACLSTADACGKRTPHQILHADGKSSLFFATGPFL